MTRLLLAAAALALASGPAFACVGTEEYPETAERLERSTIDPSTKAQLAERLAEGREMHDSAHAEGDGARMGESIRILRELQRDMRTAE